MVTDNFIGVFGKLVEQGRGLNDEKGEERG